MEVSTRVTSMGFVGVVAPQGVTGSAFYSNPALLTTEKRTLNAQATYMPWLRTLVPDMFLASVNASYQINDRHSVGLNVTNFNIGGFDFADPFGNTTFQFVSREYYSQANYSFKIGPSWSVGMALKYIYSNLGAFNITGVDFHPGKAFASDLGTVYRRAIKLDKDVTVDITGGASIVNLGQKMSYTAQRKDFIPTQMNLGLSLAPKRTMGANGVVSFLIAYQASKYLVPTPPTFQVDENGTVIRDDQGNPIIDRGYDPNVPVFTALYQSFYDAPDGAKEEWAEVNHRFAAEASVQFTKDWSFAMRTGYFHEAYVKGNRKFGTCGVGLRFKAAFVDLSNMFPSPFTDSYFIGTPGTWAASVGVRHQF